MRTHMTPARAQRWAETIKTYTSDPKGRDAESSSVMSATLYAAWDADASSPADVKVQSHGPVAVNPQIKSVQTTVASDGRLAVHIKSAADIRLVVDCKPVQMPIHRDQTFLMQKTADGWKVDGWDWSLRFGQYNPDKKAKG